MRRGRGAIDLARATRLPRAPEGWFDLCYRVAGAGGLAILRGNAEALERLRRLREENRPFSEPVSDIEPVARLSTFDGAHEQAAIAFGLDHPYPCFDRTSEGQWVVAAVRCRPGALNAALFSASGEVVRRFCLGDGIEHLQCDSAGGIWVGYFDEGVFGNLGWGFGGPEPIGAGGLVRFDDAGRALWSYAASCPAALIADCYALNVSGDGAWLCAYSDFPIAHARSDGAMRTWDNEVHGAKALAVDGAHVLLGGGYGEERDRIALVSLGDEDATCIAVGTWGDSSARGFDLLDGRGPDLHLVQDGIWYRLAVADVLKAWALQ